jgi:hypothetical protein
MLLLFLVMLSFNRGRVGHGGAHGIFWEGPPTSVCELELEWVATGLNDGPGGGVSV